MGQQFTSLDGADNTGHRAEVLVCTGNGVVSQMDDKGSNVKFMISNEVLRHPLGGWVSKKDPLFETLAEAHRAGREVSYRIEQQRKRSVDRRTPIADLRRSMEEAKTNCVWVFAGVDGVLGDEAVTNPAEDPAEGGRRRATGSPAPAAPQQASAPVASALDPKQALTALGEARQSGLPASIQDMLAALALMAGASQEQVLTVGVDPQQAPSRPQVRPACAAEAAPFKMTNTDGRLNLGSYAVQAAVGAENFAYDQIAAHAQAVADEHNAKVEAGEIEGDPISPRPVTFRMAAALGLRILDLADHVQVNTYGWRRPDRMATSHTRARSFVYDAIRTRYPVPFNADDAALQAWREAVINEGTERFRLAAEIADSFMEPPAPANSEPAPQDAAPEQAAPQVEAAASMGSADASGAGTSSTPAAESTADSTSDVTSGATDVAPDAQASAAVTEPETSEVSRIGNGERRRALVEGDEGFEPPTPEVLSRFSALCEAAGFVPGPGSPLTTYLNSRFGVMTARQVHGADLDRMLAWYAAKGPRAAQMFAEHVAREADVANAG